MYASMGVYESSQGCVVGIVSVMGARVRMGCIDFTMLHACM